MELFYDFQKAYVNVNHGFLEELLNEYGFPPGVQRLIIEMMARWRICLSYGAKKEVREVRLENGIIQGDAFSPLLFVLMIDPLIKIVKRILVDRVEILNYMDDLKASMSIIATVQTIRGIVNYANTVGMVINKKSAIQLNSETPLPESLQDIPRLDETTHKYLGFEMKRSNVERKEVMKQLGERIMEKLEEPNDESWGIRVQKSDPLHQPDCDECGPFDSEPVKFTLGWLDRIDQKIPQHLTQHVC